MSTTAGLIYTGAWLVLVALAVALVVREPAAYAFARRDYWRFLLAPWKLVTFVLAAGSFVVVAPYTGDPTWDAGDALLMSVLTYLTAPWAVGALYRVARGRLPRRQAYVAACAWMLSASWCYDLYLFARDRVYPPSWSANIGASSALYVLAGLMWSLGASPGRGVVLAFFEEDWPRPLGGLGRAWPFVAALALIVAAILGVFVMLNARR